MTSSILHPIVADLVGVDALAPVETSLGSTDYALGYTDPGITVPELQETPFLRSVALAPVSATGANDDFGVATSLQSVSATPDGAVAPRETTEWHGGNDASVVIEPSHTITGTAGDDVIDMGTWYDKAVASDGNDVIIANDRGNTILGGAGLDIVSYEHSSEAVTVDLSAGTASGGYAAGDVLVGIEGIQGSAFADVLTGNDGDNTFVASTGADVISGGAGIDTLDLSKMESLGANEWTGNDGYNITLDGTDVSYGASGDFGDATHSATATSIERVVGSAHADWIDVNDIWTTDGLTVVNGLEVNGGQGTDRIVISSLGDNQYFGEQGADVFDFNAIGQGQWSLGDFEAGTDVLGFAAWGVTWNDITQTVSGSDLLISFTAQGYDFSLTLHGISTPLDQSSFEFARTSFSSATADADTIDLGSTINDVGALSGDDFIFAGSLANNIDGSLGTDTVAYLRADAGILLDLNAPASSHGWAAGDVLTGVETIIGSNFDDDIRGNSSANTFLATYGTDHYDGREGTDILDFGSSAIIQSAGGLANGLADGVNVTSTGHSGSYSIPTAGGAAGTFDNIEVINLSAGDDVITLTDTSITEVHGNGGRDHYIVDQSSPLTIYADVTGPADDATVSLGVRNGEVTINTFTGADGSHGVIDLSQWASAGITADVTIGSESNGAQDVTISGDGNVFVLHFIGLPESGFDHSWLAA